MYAVYILKCADESYYTGLTNDLEKRLWQHETGFFPGCYTFKRRPLKLVWQTRLETAKEAGNLERQIKGWSRKKKEALINDNIDELKRLSNLKKVSSSSPLRQAQGLIDYLIIGQGISGTWLSYFLQKENKSFLVVDNNISNAPSRLAAGIINPVTGRRHVEVWMANEILPFSCQAYIQLGNDLNIQAISQKDIIDFFPSPQMRVSFQQRVEEKGNYVSICQEENKYKELFNYEFGYGEIKPVYTAHLETIIPAWRQQLLQNNQLLEESFDSTQLHVSAEKIQYKNITAQKIIFCDGNSSVTNLYFKNLPFAPNKGEALLVNIPDLPQTNIYKKGLSLVPLAIPHQWWIGSNYAWDFDNENPTEEFRMKTEALLKSWLTLPFTITKHLCGIRPATLERRPFAGLHPIHSSVGILNGMGTKGCSLAPYFAKQLSQHLMHNTPISPDADVKRFTKVLQR